MVIFNSYVKLPEGKCQSKTQCADLWFVFFSVGKCHKESSDFGMSTLSTMAMGIAVSWKYRIDASDVGMDLGGIGIQNARLVPSLITTDHSW